MLMQAQNNDDLNEGQRSSKVKYGKLCAMVTKSEKPLMQVKYDDDLHGGQRSTEIKILNNVL